MVFFNHATRQMTAKIVYYGPGLCGKTTNLNTIYAKTTQKARGEMVSLNTETDRTLFFDLLPMDVGTIGGFKAKLQLYTVPGQVFYNSTRKLVLKGVDGIVFVADSQVPMLDANKESLQNLSDNLRELGLVIGDIPMVFQWNKRDLKNIVPIEQLEAELNLRRLPSFQSVASEGAGVFETLRGVTKLALGHIKSHHLGESPAPAEVVPPPPPPPAPSPMPPPIPEPPQDHISSPTPARPLEFMDLPSASEIFGDASSQDPFSSLEAPKSEPRLPAAPVHSSPLQPLAKPLAPKASLPTPTPSAPRSSGALKLPSLTPLPLPKPKLPAPKTAMGNLLHLNVPSTTSQVIHVDLPGALGSEELEILISIRQGGQVIEQTEVHRPAPGPGALVRLSLELKRG